MGRVSGEGVSGEGVSGEGVSGEKVRGKRGSEDITRGRSLSPFTLSPLTPFFLRFFEGRSIQHCLEDLLFLISTKRLELFSQFGTSEGQDSDREQRCISSTGLSNGERSHGNTCRHLHR